MVDSSTLIAILAGILQGIFEWLPISSEGNITLFMTAVGRGPTAAVQFALFLHAGTAISATVYYRDEVVSVLQSIPAWRPGSAFQRDTAELSFITVATVASILVGGVTYLTLESVVHELAGGAFIALIGILLVGTGVLLRTADGFKLKGRASPNLFDAALVGSLQGLAILPGVSRSGTTASALLFRGFDVPSAFRLSFLLSIPAAAGAGALGLLTDGLPTVAPTAAVVAIIVSAVVGYFTIDVLMRLVERVAFWGVCVGLGTLALLGGVALAVV